jgi:chaperonin cofactor prefoldin
MSGFTTAGAIPGESLYVRRAADKELLERLRAFEYCYVLAPRQIGKSSLRIRTTLHLRELGYHVVLIDCQALAGCTDIHQVWKYFGECLNQDLLEHGLDVPEWSSWAEKEYSAASWFRYIRDVVVPAIPKGLILFFEEIDTLRSLSCDTDGIFSTLRLLHTHRTDKPALRKVGLCLIGVTRTVDLIRNPEISPFNVARAIRLKDFGQQEAEEFLLPGLGESFAQPQNILKAAFDWTSGHPYMLQNVLAEAVSSRPHRDGAGADPSLDPTTARNFIDGLIQRLFFTSDEDPNLGSARRQFEPPHLDEEQFDALNQYRMVLAGKRVPVSEGAERDVQELLRIAGLVTFEDRGGRSFLAVRNRVFRERFTQAWITRLVDRRSYDDLSIRWSTNDEHADYLLRGKALEEAEKWMKEQDSEVASLTAEFITHSRLAQRTQRLSRQRTQAFWLAPGIIALLLFMAFVSKYLEQVEEERKTLEQRVATLNAQAEANKAEFKRNQEEINTLKSDRERISKDLKAKNDDLAELEARRLSLLHKLSKDFKARRAIQEQLDTVNMDIRLATLERGKLEAELTASGQRVRFFEERISQLTTERDNTTRKLSEVHTLLDKATLAQQDLLGQLKSMEGQIQDMNRKASDLQSRYEECNATLTRNRAELDTTRSAMNSCKVQLEQHPAALTKPTEATRPERL